MKKKFLTGIFLSCMLLLPPATRAQDPDPALVAKAQQGDTAAQEKLGDYYFGQNDNANGLKWLKKSAEGGNSHAQQSLGFRYQKGQGVVKNQEEARKWYRLAVNVGRLNAAKADLCSSFAESLEITKGNNVRGEPITPIGGDKAVIDEAFKWCDAAAKHGDRFSQQRLGIFYAKGTAELKPDYEKAYFWLSRLNAGQTFRDKVGKNLTPEQRTEIEKRSNDWTPPTAPPAPKK